MATPKRYRVHRESENDNLGLTANGSSGPWEVAVDETTSGPRRWFAQIEGPTIYCSFEIPSPEMVAKALEFLGGDDAPEELHTGPTDQDGSLVLGKHPETPVVLIRDDEYTDRYFLVIGPDTACARLSIAGEDLKHLTEALRQTAEDIEEER